MTETLEGCLTLLALSWRQNPVKLTLAIGLKLGEAAALPLSAPALGALTDAAVAGDIPRASLAGAAVAVLTIAVLVLGHFAHIAYFELGELNFLTLDREMITLANGSAGLEHHERPEYADNVKVLEQELHRASASAMEALLSGISLTLAITITAVLLGLLNPWLLLLPLAAVPPLLLGRRAEVLHAAAREAAAASTRGAWHLFRLATDAGSAKELRVFGLRAEIRRRHDTLWRSATGVVWRAERRAALLRIGGQLVFAVAYVGATLLVVRDAVAGRRSVGDVVLAVSLAAMVNQQVTAAVGLLQDLQRVARSLATFHWLRAVVATRDPALPPAAVPERIRHGIHLRDVGFVYPGTSRAVLDKVDLFLPAGSTVAVVGENGAGKTSLVKLLCRFYTPSTGVIEVDGVDIERFPLDAWRARIAAGFQDFARFEFLARETVGVGDLALIESAEAVTAALERARSADIIDRLEQGLETQLGKSYADGTELSGGQWQKLALGRAMMRETPLLLVLDEPTSALDAEAEHLLFERYAANAKRVAAGTGAITVLVSHRFSTVRMADLIVVIDGGRVTEVGDHDRLAADGGLYADLFALQAAAYR